MDIFDAFGSGRNILLHGPSGTGKTYTMNELIRLVKLNHTNNEFNIAAPTGMAAILIDGSTIHSQFGIRSYRIPDDLLDNLEQTVAEYDPTAEYTDSDGYLYELRIFISGISSRSHFKDSSLKYLFIDEISMTGAVLLLIIDNILRKLDANKKHLPMGGVQCIFSGDFFQLPPVKDEFCCFTKLWQQMDIHVVNMEESKRYIGDESVKHFEFICRLRKARLTSTDKQLLTDRKNAYIKKEYESLRIEPLILCATNDKIDSINNERLRMINDTEYVFNAVDTKNIFRSGLSADQIKNCETNIDRTLDDIMPKKLKVKVGAQIIFIINYDIQSKLVNGRMCRIEEIREITNSIDTDMDAEITDDNILDLIKVDKKPTNVDIADKDIYKYEIVVSDIDGIKHVISPTSKSSQTRRFTCSRTQFPFKLAWAISIHRSQGLTLDSAKIDISNVFCSGQSYVAISRVSSVDNIFISKYNANKIYANKKIMKMFG